MKIDPSCCRLCFVHADESIDIFGDAVTEFNIVGVLAQYFLDQVTQDDALPKVVCHDCWSQIETFHSFVQRVIAIRDDYLRQPLNNCVKEEETPDELTVLMDETEIHQENVCVEPVLLASGDPLAVEVGIMDTKFQIDMETEENGAVLSNDEECDDIGSNTDQIGDQDSLHFHAVGYGQEIREMVLNVSEDQIKEAMDTHIEKTCGSCGTELSSFLDARNHYLKFHNSLGHIRCCNYKLKTNTAFLDHIYWHLNPTVFVCRICQEDKETRENLLEHLKVHGILDTKRFTCEECEKTFDALYLLTGHVSSCHSQKTYQPNEESMPSDDPLTGQRTPNGISMKKSSIVKQKDDTAIADYFDMTCDLCPIVFTSFKDAKSHYLNVHRMEGYLKCCQTKLKTIILIEDHMAWHKDPNAFRCNECKKSCLNRYALSVHTKNHTKKFVCEICSRAFPFAWYLTKHMSSHEERERNFICGVCNKGFHSQDTLRNHERIHKQDEAYICEFCAKVFKSQASFKLHLTIHNQTNTERQFQCNICEKWLTTKYILADHMTRHSSEPQKCGQCDKISPNINALQIHIRRVHCESKFECHLCDKKFKLNTALKDHIATHKGERNYKCTFCDETFVWRMNMYAHRKKMHKEQWMAEKDRNKRKRLKH